MNNLGSNIERIKAKMKINELVIGTVVSIPDPDISEILCTCGYDFIWIDAEHSSMDKKAVDLHILATRAHGVASIVRVPWNDPVLVKPILDMGPAGIIFPLIRNKDDAELAVKSCKYPPLGIRGFGPRRANLFSKIETKKYLKLSETEPWVILQIEHAEAVENLKAILKVRGIDCIIIGPNDLSASIGHLGDPFHQEVEDLIDKIAYLCNENNIPFGPATGYGNRSNIEKWAKRGARLLAIDWDVGHLRVGAKEAYKKVEEVFKLEKESK